MSGVLSIPKEELAKAPRVWVHVGSGMRVSKPDPLWVERYLASRASDAPQELPPIDSWKKALHAVAELRRIPAEQITGPSKRFDVVGARYEVIRIMRHDLGMSLASIGRRLGGRDHSTIANALAAPRERKRPVIARMPRRQMNEAEYRFLVKAEAGEAVRMSDRPNWNARARCRAWRYVRYIPHCRLWVLTEEGRDALAAYRRKSEQEAA